MKNLAILFAMLLALPCAAQLDVVQVEVQLDQEQYLPNEPLVAHVKIQNSSGQTIRLGEDPGWLNFVVETLQGPMVTQLKMPEVSGAFDLPSSHTATKHVDLGSCFSLLKRGSYKVIATVKVPAFGTAAAFASPGKKFFIGNGSERWKTAFGAPPNVAAPGPDGRPEMRKYILVESTPGSGSSKLFLRVTDANEDNLRVLMVGTLVSFSKPEPQLDRWSNLHLLYQTGAKSFQYLEVNPEGLVLARERHDYAESRPTLISNDEGRISVRGGLRRYTKDDLPPVDPTDALAPTEAEEAPLALNPPAAPKDSKKKESPRSTDAKVIKKK